MSGSALSPWAAVQEPVYYAVQAARQLGCDVPDDLYRHYETLLHCLRDRTVDQILQVHAFPLCESVCNRQHKSKVAGSDRIRIDLLDICMSARPFVLTVVAKVIKIITIPILAKVKERIEIVIIKK